MNNINRDNVSAAPLPDNGSQLVKQIASYSKIVSFRLHSHIIAYSCKIPSFGFIWDDKVKDFFAMTGNMGNCCELNNINIADIVHFAEAGESHFDKLDLLQQESENSLISNVCNIV